MAITKIQSESMNLADTYNFTGDVTGAGGITVADNWRITADVTSNTDPISSNLEQVDTAGQGTLGSAMTVSSGRFTFPSTGIYYVAFTSYCDTTSGGDNVGIAINATTNNSSYAEVARNFFGGSDARAGTAHCSTLIDVTDTSNVKVSFEAFSIDSGSKLQGTSDKTESGMMFIRLGDT